MYRVTEAAKVVTTLHHTFYLDNRCDAAVVERKTHAKISWERVFFVTQENEEFSALSDKNAKKKTKII